MTLIIFLGIQSTSHSAFAKQEIADGVREFILDKIDEQGVNLDSFMAMHKHRLVQYESVYNAIMDEEDSDSMLFACDKLCDTLQGVMRYRGAVPDLAAGMKVLSYFSSRIIEGVPIISRVIDDFLDRE